ncbi:MAG TPA: hypothetical protein VHW09_26740 [Bryobacteraceae bacterium]|jgi:hypothetical protein|nr:hypothetical protein [Bryobacteraceae bacterium]
MSRQLDWLISAVIMAVVIMAEYRLVFFGVFEPLPLVSGIALLLLIRVINQHLPRLIAAKRKR